MKIRYVRVIRYFGSRNKRARSTGISATLKRCILNVKNNVSGSGFNDDFPRNRFRSSWIRILLRTRLSGKATKRTEEFFGFRYGIGSNIL
jgi:hypothetical protein